MEEEEEEEGSLPAYHHVFVASLYLSHFSRVVAIARRTITLFIKFLLFLISLGVLPLVFSPIEHNCPTQHGSNPTLILLISVYVLDLFPFSMAYIFYVMFSSLRLGGIQL